MIRDKKPLIIAGAVLGVLLIAGGGVFYLRQKKPSEVATVPEEPRQERQLPVTPPPAEEMPYESYTTADGNLSFEYPAAWTRTEIQNLKTVLPQEFIDKYQLTMPLLLSDPRGERCSLSIYRLEKEMDLNGLMDALKADLVAMGQPYNEISRQMVGDSLVVDSTVDAQGVVVQVRDILFLTPSDPKNTIYNLSFFARDSSWGEYENIFDHIQSSVQLSP